MPSLVMYRIDELEAIKKQDEKTIEEWLEDKLVKDNKFPDLKCGVCKKGLKEYISHEWFGRFYCSKECAMPDLKKIVYNERMAEIYREWKEEDIKLREHFRKDLCRKENKDSELACDACKKTNLDEIVQYSKYPFRGTSYCSEECALPDLIEMYYLLLYG
jgi:hypothetical protein